MLTGPQRAAQVIWFIEKYCVHIDGADVGKPIELREWQKEPLVEIYGALDEDGLREVQTALLIMTKKTGKTTILCAGMALYGMTFGAAQGAKIFSIANAREQAAQLFDSCAAQIQLSEPLQGLGFDPDYDIKKNIHRIFYRPRNSQFRAVAAENIALRAIHGEKPSLLFVDEIHAMRDRLLIDALKLGMGTMPEPLTVMTTNHGDLDTSPVFWEEYAKAKKWLAQPKAERNPAYYAKIYETDLAIKDDDVLTEGKHWFEVNPHLGDFMSLKFLRNEVAEAKELPSKKPNVLRFNFGRAVQSETAWLKLAEWDACEFTPRRTPELTDDLTDYELLAEDLKGRECFMGCDLSSTLDITANAYLFPDEDGGLTLFERLWLPEENIRDLERQCEVPLQEWAKQGYITLTPGNSVDYKTMEDDIVANSKRYKIRTNGMDKWNAVATAQNLDRAGVQTVFVSQTAPVLNEPAKAFEALIKAGKFPHLKNPATRWMVSVVTIRTDDNGNFRPIKPKIRAEGKRVDVIQAIVNAVYCWQQQPPVSVYESRGILAV